MIWRYKNKIELNIYSLILARLHVIPLSLFPACIYHRLYKKMDNVSTCSHCKKKKKDLDTGAAILRFCAVVVIWVGAAVNRLQAGLSF